MRRADKVLLINGDIIEAVGLSRGRKRSARGLNSGSGGGLEPLGLQDGLTRSSGTPNTPAYCSDKPHFHENHDPPDISCMIRFQMIIYLTELATG